MKMNEILKEDELSEDRTGAVASLLNWGFNKLAGKATRSAANKAAAKAAKTAADAKAVKTFGKLSPLAKAGVAAQATGKVAKFGLLTLTPMMIHVYNAYNIYGFFKEYNENVDAWEKELRSRGLSGPELEQKMAYIRQQEMGLLVPKIGAALLGSAIIRGTTAPIAALLKGSKFTAPIGLAVGGLGRVGTMYLYNKLNSKEGSEMFANVLVGNAAGEWAKDVMGTAGVNAVDWMKGVTKDAQEADKKGDPTAAGNGTQNANGAGSTTPVAAPIATGGQTTQVTPGAQVIADPDKNKLDVGGANSATAGTTSGKIYTPIGYKRDAEGNLQLDDD